MAQHPLPRDASPLSPHTLRMLVDPLQELCPSLESVQMLCEQPTTALPGGQQFQVQRIHKAILAAASSSDMDMLHWICFEMSKPLAQRSHPFTLVHWHEVRDPHGSGPVNLAASSSHADVVRLLVRSGADVNERDACGWTPVMWAINCGNLPLVSFLLSYGADVDAKTNKGASCEDFILSTTPEVGSTKHPSDPLLLDNAPPPSPMTSDRHLIGDLIYEHQKVKLSEQGRSMGFHEHGNPFQHDNRPASPHVRNEHRAASPLARSELSSPTRLDARMSTSASTADSFGTHSRHSSVSTRRLMGRNERTHLAEKGIRQRELAEGRRRALLDVAVMLQVEYQDLLGDTPTLSNPGRKAHAAKPVHSGLASGCGAIEVGADALSNDFDFRTVRPDQMLVFGEKNVQALVDLLVRDTRPVRAPWVSRSRPSNVLYLCIRYACHFNDQDGLEELVTTFVEAVENVIYAHPTETTYLAFWLHNSVLLLHYFQRDTTLVQFDCEREYVGVLAELVNEVYMFVVRDIEQRMDKVLDAAILEHEAIDVLDGLQYEDEWSFIKTLRGSVKNLHQGSSPSTPTRRRPLSQVFSNDERFSRHSPSLFSGPLSPEKRSGAHGEPSPDASVADLLSAPSPRTITTQLTSVLHVLQLYEINPSIIVQILSQVFFWVGSELFNRILTQKKFLCKARAMQVRLNISSLEDWIKTNALPMAIVSDHFAPLKQLVSWVLCQSSLQEFDGLISTLQGLKKLSPVQLRRVLRDYRYEVGEARMSEECIAYLDQLQIDWDRRRLENRRLSTASPHHYHGRSGTATEDNPHPDGDTDVGRASNTHGDAFNDSDSLQDVSLHSTATATAPEDATARAVQAAIDSLFLPGRSMADYVPHPLHNTPSDTELLNSRDMLPFALPSRAELLVVSPGDAFGFGRGHFMGTGTPSLKSMRSNSLVASPTVHGSSVRALSQSSSPVKSHCSLPPSGLGIDAKDLTSALQGHTDPSIDSLSSTSATSDQDSAFSLLYPQGKGLAAGASWQPVPLLPEGTLDILAQVMR